MADDGYVHGYSAEEMSRLTRMQDILNDAELRELDLAGVRSLLDVGCGLGQLTRALARRLGEGARVVGIERDPRQRAEAERQAREAGEEGLVEWWAGDATALPLGEAERGSFDLVHARFLLEHVADPAAAVREMVSAVRPGGRVVLVDDDHDVLRLWPPCEPVERAWRRYFETYADLGHDPFVGRRLTGLLVDAGAVPTRVSVVFYGAVRGGPRFGAVVDNLVEVLAGAAPALASSGRMTREATVRALDAFRDWSRTDGAAVWYSLPLAEGRRPGA